MGVKTYHAPRELLARMVRFPGTNWSAAARAGVQREVERLERRERALRRNTELGAKH